MRPQAESNFAVRRFFKYKLDSTQSYYIIILTSIIYMALLSLSQHAVIKCFSLHFITAPKFHFVVQSQRLPKRKDSRGFCKRTNKVHKFKGCFLRRREKKIENLLFSESTANVSSSRQQVLPDRLMFINFSQEMGDCD